MLLESNVPPKFWSLKVIASKYIYICDCTGLRIANACMHVLVCRSVVLGRVMFVSISACRLRMDRLEASTHSLYVLGNLHLPRSCG